MKRALALSLVLPLAAAGRAVFAKDQCVACHASLEGKHKAILRSFETDIHRESGLSCASCHGGDPSKADAAQAMSPEAGFTPAPSPADIPAFCGKCHSDPGTMKKYNPSLPVDQAVKYFTSVHGQRLKKGDDKVATCVSCHTTHAIRPSKDPLSSVYPKNIPQTCGKCHSDPKRMAPYKIPSDQAAKYVRSVHGRALLERGDTAAPVCNTCHGNHGAAPPGVESIGRICGMCHSQNEQFFLSSPMAKPWKSRKYHICATCHTEHGIQHPTPELLSPDKGLCSRCHKPSSEPIRDAAAMRDKLVQMEGAYQSAKSAIFIAEEKGMDMSEARDLWDGSRMSFYQSRTAVHAFRPAKVAEIADKGIEAAQKAKKAADDAVEEFRFRRIGLGVASLLITFLVLAIYLKVRDIESRPS